MRRLISLLVLTLLVTVPAFAQKIAAPAQTAPPPQATAPAAPKAQDAPRAPYLGRTAEFPPAPPTTNIRLELTITDTHTGMPVVKSVSLLVLTNNSGMIRTSNPGNGGSEMAILNVDANAAAYQNGTVAVRMTFEFTPAPVPVTDDENRGRRYPPRLNESITVLLKDGIPMLVSQSADPATDRKVTTELTATILK
ncbi:MAG: hypothetical protein HQ485_12080 [Acidobacteria bacterium]|nr:hypothetical protein [Acidobacteriota bacterium]